MKNKLSVIAALCALICLITASSQVIGSARGALELCLELILPSLFPFFVVCGLLSRLGFPAWLGRLIGPASGRLLHVSGRGASAFVVGITGGYPMGAGYIADMLRGGAVSLAEAERLLAFCNNSGPAFIIGAVGTGVFGSAKIGLLLYAVHILTALIVGLLFSRFGPSGGDASPAAAGPEPARFSAALTDSVRQAVVSALNVCGFVVCFTVFAGLLEANGFLPAVSGRIASAFGLELHWAKALLTGILELGSGIGAMRGLTATPANLALAAGLLGWGGISVRFQTAAMLADTDIKGALHGAGRLMSAVIGAGLAWLAAGLIL